MGSLPTSRHKIYCTSEHTQKVHGWVLRQFWLRKEDEAKNNTKKLMVQSGSWYKVDFLDVHRNTCDFSNKRDVETIFKVSVIRFKGPSRDISVERFL